MSDANGAAKRHLDGCGYVSAVSPRTASRRTVSVQFAPEGGCVDLVTGSFPRVL